MAAVAGAEKSVTFKTFEMPGYENWHLCEIGGKRCAILHTPLENVPEVTIPFKADKWIVILAAPIRSLGKIYIDGIAVFILDHLHSNTKNCIIQAPCYKLIPEDLFDTKARAAILALRLSLIQGTHQERALALSALFSRVKI
jgi:hypothetical protein